MKTHERIIYNENRDDWASLDSSAIIIQLIILFSWTEIAHAVGLHYYLNTTISLHSLLNFLLVGEIRNEIKK